MWVLNKSVRIICFVLRLLDHLVITNTSCSTGLSNLWRKTIFCRRITKVGLHIRDFVLRRWFLYITQAIWAKITVVITTGVLICIPTACVMTLKAQELNDSLILWFVGPFPPSYPFEWPPSIGSLDAPLYIVHVWQTWWPRYVLESSFAARSSTSAGI